MNFVSDIDSIVKKIRDRYTSAQHMAFLAVMIVGIVAHGFVIFNRLSYHDNSASLYSLGATYESGRWGLGILYKIQLLTSKTFSVPVFNSVLSLIFIGLAAMAIVEIFRVNSKVIGAYIGAILVAFPVVTSIFSFMFTSWPYVLGFLLAVESAHILCKNLSAPRVIAAALVLACSLGLYQAFLGVAVTIFLARLLMDVISGRITTVKRYASDGFAYLISLGLGLMLWQLIAVAFRTVKGVEAVVYKGMEAGYDISKLPSRLLVALQSFFAFDIEGINHLRYLRILFFAIFIVALLQIVILLFKRVDGIALKIAAIIGTLLIPIGIKVIYLLSTSDSYIVDSLMLYADVFEILIPVFLIQELDTVSIKNAILKKATKLLTWLQILAILVIAVGYIYLDNAAYLKMDLYQEEAVAYFTALLANIKSTDGFSDDMEIVFVGIEKISDGTIAEVASNEQMDGVRLEKYYNSLDNTIRYSGNLDFIREHCGYGNELVSMDDGTYADMAEVKAMPTYPNDGGIAIIDNTLIVKFGE